MSVNAIIYQDESGAYCAEVPSMPGCHSDGRTYEEAAANISEAVALWMEAQDVGLTPSEILSGAQ